MISVLWQRYPMIHNFFHVTIAPPNFRARVNNMNSFSFFRNVHHAFVDVRLPWCCLRLIVYCPYKFCAQVVNIWNDSSKSSGVHLSSVVFLWKLGPILDTWLLKHFETVYIIGCFHESISSFQRWNLKTREVFVQIFVEVRSLCHPLSQAPQWLRKKYRPFPVSAEQRIFWTCSC